MATYLIGNGVYQSSSHQPASTLPAVAIGIKAAFRMVSTAFHQANAARHIYDGLLACDMPRDVAARRTFEILFSKPATH
ncbi:MAG: hypothetical protein AB7U75_08465 [Hyphomicrobiaceae bacterium]